MPQNTLGNVNTSEKEPIAIIGMGCRFPGGANSPEAFWKLLVDGVDAITEVPSDRWNLSRFYDSDRGKAGKTYTRHGGFIEQIDQFDAEFFGISPREAVWMDPQQRLLLEVVWEALEDGGQVPERLTGTRTGVFVGVMVQDYQDIQASPSNRNSINAHTGTGSMSMSIIANRVSYVFDFRGPSIALDTACSSALVAVHLACQSIWNQESEMALAGGVNAMLKPELTIAESKASMLSADGRCQSFDARANGYVRGEGAGIVVLKPLSQAQTDGDPIYAVIRGSAVNQDGRTKGITVPNGQAQEVAIRQACKQAGILPEQIQYVEAHGTGTPVGDPIEANAIGNVLGKNRLPEDYCIIGSVKTNIGHLESAAGVAGLIKATLIVKYGLIPPNLHFLSPNPNILFEELRLRVPTALEAWPNGSGLRIAGVNSFGFGGTNGHILVAQAPERADCGAGSQSVSDMYAESKTKNQKSFLLPLSARSSEALKALASKYKDFLITEDSSLSDICYSASLRRSHHSRRLCVVGDSKQELAEHLEAFLAGESRLGMSGERLLPDKPPKLAFVFSGMGQQWWAMGRSLLSEEPVFRETLQRCDELLRQYTDWSLLEELTASEENSRIHATQIAQCAIFSVQVALSALWRSWGIIPEAIVGHSVGEVAAAHVAGVLSLEDAVRVIFHRSRLQAKIAGTGRMLAVGLSLESVEQLLAGYEDLVSVGAVNSPSSVTLAGDASILEKIAQTLEEKQIFCRFLQVEVPYHSLFMEPLKAELAECLQEINPQAATIPLFSTVTGQQVKGPEIDGVYWGQNMRNPVLFAKAVEGLMGAGYSLFLEIGAHPVLASYISECSVKASQTATALPSLRRKEPETVVMLGSFGKLYTLGYPVDWHRLYPEGQFVQLPSYPWQRSRCWHESEESQQDRLGQSERRTVLGVSVHPLLGSRLESPQPQWNASLDKAKLTYLKDHCIQGVPVYPAAAYVEMALVAGKEIFGEGRYVLEDIEFHKALFLPDEPVIVQLSVDRGSPASFDIHSQAKGEGASWVRHASGNFFGNHNDLVPQPVVLDEIRARCTNEISKSDRYQQLQEMGLEYGPTFQGVERLWFGGGEALAQLRVSETLEKELNDYQLHPALLDACFQGLISTISESATYLPVQIKRLRVYSRPGLQVWSYARLVEQNAKQIKGDIRLLDESGNVLVEIRGFCCQSLGKARDTTRTKENYLYEYQWKLQAHPARALVPQRQGSWLIFADRDGVGQQLARLLKQREQTPLLISAGTEYKRLDADFFQIRPEHPEDMQQLLEAVSSSHPALSGAIHLWSLDITPVEQTTVASLEKSQTLGCLSVLHLVQALERAGISLHLWLVTRGCFAVEDSVKSVEVAQSPLWGLGRVINNELPSLQCTRVDLSLAQRPEEIQALEATLWSDEPEDEIALRGGTRYVHRLMPISLDEIAREKKKPVRASSQPFRLEVSQPGILDSLILRSTARQKPRPGEVEIEVCATGLNFKDVAKAMNILADANLEGNFWQRSVGMECAGRISAIGSGVEGFDIGDEVIAFAPGSFGTYTTTDARFVARKPRSLSFEEAATIPLVFFTAYYALHYLTRISKGDRILIHAAAGGVGLAAIQLAQKAGAEIFATASSPEKREFLKALGVHHVMDSRSTAFADEVMDGGRGVDIVLNSLAGEAIPKSLSVLAPYGRFIEIGKRDIDGNSKLGLQPFQNNLSFFAVDVDRLLRERPDFSGELFREIMKHFEESTLHPLPHRVFPISKVLDAFRYMAGALHIGKIVVSLQDPDVVVAPATGEKVTFRPDGTYLIVGGLGGFSLAVAQWLVQNGAKHLVLMSRSGAASPAAQKALKTLSEAGAKVVAAKADVTQAHQVADVLAEIDRSMPPLRGIVHSAVVYDDAALAQLDRERFFKVMAPKLLGAWNLHALSLNAPLDFFINFSSIASLVGNPGQGNYVAANAFLDALAHYRHALGLPALTVNWGAIGNVGYIARNAEISKHIERVGLKLLSAEQALSVLNKLLLLKTIQIAIAPIDWQRWCFVHKAGTSGRFSVLADKKAISQKAGESNDKEDSFLNVLMEREPAERRQMLELRLRELLARVWGTSVTKLDSSKSLISLGLDSLMAVELSNLIRSDVNLSISTMKLMQGPTISQLAGELIEQLTANASTRSYSSVTPATTDWLVFPKQNPDACLRLFCFSYNGGSSSAFIPWFDRLPSDIEICAIQLPGGADRLDEQPFDRLTQLLETLTQVLFPYLDKPFAFYGHSMGGLIGFELAHHLYREHNKLPAHLFVGASWAPQLPSPYSSVAPLSNFDFPELSQQNAEFMRLSLPSLKAGYLLFKNYSCSNEQPLSCPITVFGGMQDRVVTQDYLSPWRGQTNSTFKLQMLPGNHLFLLSDLDLLLPMISEDIKLSLKK